MGDYNCVSFDLQCDYGLKRAQGRRSYKSENLQTHLSSDCFVVREKIRPKMFELHLRLQLKIPGTARALRPTIQTPRFWNLRLRKYLMPWKFQEVKVMLLEVKEVTLTADFAN